MPSGAPSDVRITGLSLTHTFVGDLVATLIAPNGTTSHVLFGRTGAITASGFGDSSRVSGPYTFADDAAGNWWTAAQTATGDASISPGGYRTSVMGGAGSTGAVTSMTSAFSAITNANGTWTLRVTDGCGANIGVVNAATLELAPKCAAQQLAVTAAQARVATANAAVPPASAAAAAADKAVQTGTAAVTKATKAVDKAKKTLKNAKASGNAGKIKKAKKKLKAAKKAFKSAESALATAQQAAASARQNLTSAQAAATAAQAQLTSAQSALTACQGTV
jgi:subtilisin-like proprotein convertase family protein